MYFFTADEHYAHKRVIEYCKRPFSSVEEMNESFIANFNEVVSGSDVTVHVGDFCFESNREYVNKHYVRKLNGQHIFLRGSHDRWLPKSAKRIWTKVIEGQYVMACHYAMRVWERSHYGSWMLYGHSHGTLPPLENQWDVGVDCNNYYPISFYQLKKIMNSGCRFSG